jgi:hypothetical protein
MFVLAQGVAVAAETMRGRVDVVAIAGIVGTLIGTLIGALVALWVQKRQLDNENKTRFHEERLKVYAEFNAASNSMMASLAVHMQATAETAIMIRSFETLRLIASDHVSQAATRVHAIVGNALRGQIVLEAGQWPTFNAEMATLCTAMRAEVGVTLNAV